MPEELLTLKQVFRCTSFKTRNTIVKLVGEGKFPAPIRIGANSLRWKKSEVDAWVADCPRELY